MAADARNSQGRAAGVALVVAGLLVGFGLAHLEWAPSGPPAKAPSGPIVPPKATAESLARGAAVYERQCATCHGEQGKGDGRAAWLLYPRPRDFTAGRFRLVSTENGQPTDEDLFRTISRGMPGSAMPAWSHLSEAERWGLVHHVRKLARDGRIAQIVAKGRTEEEAIGIADKILTPGALVSIPPETTVGPDELARGRELYLSSCAGCHDVDGKGRKKRDLVDSSGHPILARDFTAGVFKGGSDSVSLARRLLAGMPDTPMPSFRQTLRSDANLWAVIHYVQSLVAQNAGLRVEASQRTIPVARVEGPVATDAASPLWSTARPVYLALTPLWWRDRRAEGVTVRGIHDGAKLALHFTWEDAAPEDHMLGQTQFPDAAAVQFSPSLDPPFFAMGQTGEPVQIWLWKACWQRDLVSYADVEDVHPEMAVDAYPSLKDPPHGQHMAKEQFSTRGFHPDFLTATGAGNPVSTLDRRTPVESLSAQGFGSLASHPARFQNVDGRGEYADGVWRLVLVRDLAGAGGDDLALAPGRTVSAGFAVWDGGAGDRNGLKSVSIWHRLEIEE